MNGSVGNNKGLLVVAFDGWDDAASAASGMILHALAVSPHTTVSELDIDEFHDFQADRPHLYGPANPDGVAWPMVHIHRLDVDLETPVFMLAGHEPRNQWRKFCSAVLAAATELGIDHVITLGARYGDALHSFPIEIRGHSTNQALTRRLGLSPSDDRGPIGITAALAQVAIARELTTTSLWATIPMYTSDQSCPKASLALAEIVTALCGWTLSVRELVDDAHVWQASVDAEVGNDPKLAEEVASLARRMAHRNDQRCHGVAAEAERLLRRHDRPR